jgi:hypothetical protein
VVETGIYTGSRDGFEWLSLGTRHALLGSLLETIPEVVVGHFVAVNSFDSSPITPNDDEKALGWFCDGEVLWTSRIADPQILPRGGYDEWYVLDSQTKLPRLERLVNHPAFTPAIEDWAALLRDNPSLDPQPDRHLVRLLELFWQQMRQVDPISYVAEGDCLNFATRDRVVFTRVLEWSRQIPA